ncbi:hypothetical protein D9M71_407200 [compost metagenome]
MLGEDVTGLAQRAGHHRLTLRSGGRVAVGVQQAHAVEAAVHGWTHQVVEAGIHQDEVVVTHILHRTHFAEQAAGFSHQETPRFQLQAHRMLHDALDFAAGQVPQLGIARNVHRRVVLAIGNRQAAAGGNRFQVAAQVAHRADHGAADFLQVAVVDARTDVHVQPHQHQAVFADHRHRVVQLAVPNAVLAVLTAGVGLLAVAMAEAGVDAQPDAVAGARLAKLGEHVDGADVHLDAQFHGARQRGAVEQVAGQHHAGRFTLGRVAGQQRAFDLAEGHRVHLHALLAHQPQNAQVGAGLLGEADHVEALELGDALADHRGVVAPQRGAVFTGEVGEGGGGNVRAHGGLQNRNGVMMARPGDSIKYQFINSPFIIDMD